MKQKPSICLFMLLLIFLQTTLTLDVWAQTTRTQAGAAFPRIEPDPKAQEFFILGRQNNGLNTNPASDQTNYSWKDFAEISLWASGDSSAANLQKIIDMVETLKNSNNFPVSEKEKAEFILTFLHTNILKSYSLYQTRIDTVFSNGRFNCVSSAVLYM
ncbi:MAG: hypothetical protein LBU66_08785, partial [Treponema sp.]|nr:hypothetical protein [Treponema sp.]